MLKDFWLLLVWLSMDYNRPIIYNTMADHGSLTFLLVLRRVRRFGLSLLFTLYFLLFHSFFFYFFSLDSLFFLLLSFHGLDLKSYFFFDFLNDFIVVELLSFLEFGLSDAEGVIVLIDSIFSLSFPDLYLLDDSDQVIA